MLIYVIYKKVKWNNEKILTLSLWVLVTVTYLLPRMHERYMFVGEVISIIYFIIYRKNLPLILIINFSTLITYSQYLTNLSFNYIQLISLIYGIIIVYFTKNLFEFLNLCIKIKLITLIKRDK